MRDLLEWDQWGTQQKKDFLNPDSKEHSSWAQTSPTQGKKTLSRYFSSDMGLSHLLPEDAALHWEDEPVGVHGAVGQCWSWGSTVLAGGLSLIHTGGSERGNSGVSCIKPCHLAESSEHLAAKTSTGRHLKVYCSSLSLKPVQLCKDIHLPRRMSVGKNECIILVIVEHRKMSECWWWWTF